MKERVFYSLQARILFFSIAIVFALLSILGYSSYRISANVIMKQVSESNHKTVIQTGNNIERVMKKAHEMSLSMYHSEEVTNYLKLTSEDNNEMIYEVMRKMKQYMTMLLVFNDEIDSIYLKSNKGFEFFTKEKMAGLSPRTIEENKN